MTAVFCDETCNIAGVARNSHANGLLHQQTILGEKIDLVANVLEILWPSIHLYLCWEYSWRPRKLTEKKVILRRSQSGRRGRKVLVSSTVRVRLRTKPRLHNLNSITSRFLASYWVTRAECLSRVWPRCHLEIFRQRAAADSGSRPLVYSWTESLFRSYSLFAVISLLAQ